MISKEEFHENWNIIADAVARGVCHPDLVLPAICNVMVYQEQNKIQAPVNTCKCGGPCKPVVYPVGTEKILGVPEEKPKVKYCIRAFEGDSSEWGASIVETPLEVGDIGHSSGVISFVEPREYKRDRKFREKVAPMLKEILEAMKNKECINWASYQHDFHAVLCDLEDTDESSD